MRDQPDGTFGDDLKDGELDMVCGGVANSIDPTPCSIRTSCGYATASCAPSSCGHAGPSNFPYLVT
ncbi:MAG TPA: hypothetical protein PKM88_05655 [bacterium]|nr:hypothetical protein [bacterium]